MIGIGSPKKEQYIHGQGCDNSDDPEPELVEYGELKRLDRHKKQGEEKDPDNPRSFGVADSFVYPARPAVENDFGLVVPQTAFRTQAGFTQNPRANSRSWADGSVQARRDSKRARSHRLTNIS